MSGWLVWRAHLLGVRPSIIVRMVAIDWLAGSVPLIDDLFAVAWKANQRNLVLLRQELRSAPSDARG